jgi:hypothetical protein
MREAWGPRGGSDACMHVMQMYIIVGQLELHTMCNAWASMCQLRSTVISDGSIFMILCCVGLSHCTRAMLMATWPNFCLTPSAH